MLTLIVVYFLVLFSIVVHGLSIPALNAFYEWRGVPVIQEEDPSEIAILSHSEPLGTNARRSSKRNTVVVHNRFSRTNMIISGPMEPSRWNDDGKRQSWQSFEKQRELV